MPNNVNFERRHVAQLEFRKQAPSFCKNDKVGQQTFEKAKNAKKDSKSKGQQKNWKLLLIYFYLKIERIYQLQLNY